MGIMYKRGIGFIILAALSILVLTVISFIPSQQVRAATFSNTALKWTKQLSAGSGAWQSVTWSPELGKLVAVATQSTFPFATLNRTMTSADGKVWSLVAMPGSRPLLSSVTWSPDLNMFAAVTCGDATGSACQATTTNSSVVTSPDGTTWTTRTNPDITATWRSVTWAPGVGFVAVADSGTNRVMTSADGITWTGHTASQANAWRSVTWSPELGLFVAVATSGTNRVMTSPDGITWTNQTASEANSWSAVTWSSDLNLFVAVSQDGTNRAMTSPDGTTWTPRATPGASAWSSVVWSPELEMFVAVANSGTNRVMTSSDGVTWTGNSASVDNAWNAITWAPELEAFVAVSSTGAAGNPIATGSYRAMTGSMATAGTDLATNIAARSATFNGEYLDNFPGANVFFRYRIANSGDPFTDTSPQAVTAEGTFTENTSDLLPDTNYEYKAVVQWPSANGTETLEGGLQTFATILADDDSDDIFNVVEDAAPNSGDANNDGIADSAQPYVGSFINSATGKYAVLEVDDVCQINTVGAVAESGNTSIDTGYDYPVGLMRFQADCGTAGYTTTVNQYYYDTNMNGFALRKYNPNSDTYFTVDGAHLGQATIDDYVLTKATFQVTDGGALDIDGMVDGVIVDPAGLALPAASSSSESLASTGQDMRLSGSLTALLILGGSSSIYGVIRYKRKTTPFRPR